MFCHVPPENVLAVHDCPSMYHVPILLESQGALKVIMNRLQMEPRHNPDTSGLFNKWKQLADRVERLHESVNIALVGKYTELQDSYISVVKSLEHASLSCNRKLNLLVSLPRRTSN
jgi:CTP synthase